MANPKISARMCRAARALLGQTQAKLAEASGLSLATLRRFEVGEGHLLSDKNETKLLDYLSGKLTLVYKDDRVTGLFEQGARRKSSPVQVKKEKLP